MFNEVNVTFTNVNLLFCDKQLGSCQTTELCVYCEIKYINKPEVFMCSLSFLS